MDIRPYAILPEFRIIRVKHLKLEESWWKRGQYPASIYEREVADVERVLLSASNLKRLHCRHDLRHSFVEFKLRKELFSAASVALRLTYLPDEYWEDKLKSYPV